MREKRKLQIEFSNRFNKDRQNAPLDIKISLRESLEIFIENPDDISLHKHSLHKLGKRYYGLWSISVTDDWRAIYRNREGKIIFLMLRTHKKLYAK